MYQLATMHTICRIVFFVCAALYLCAAAVDQWVILETHQKQATFNLTTNTMTTGDDFVKQVETYGLFTAEIRGAASLQTDWTHVMIDCHQGLDTLLDMKPSGTCSNQCIAKKALVVIACALAWFGLFVLTDTNEGFKTVESVSARRIGASFVFFSAIAGMIVLAFMGASMTESSTVTEGEAGIYGPDMGICAYAAAPHLSSRGFDPANTTTPARAATRWGPTTSWWSPRPMTLATVRRSSWLRSPRSCRGSPPCATLCSGRTTPTEEGHRLHCVIPWYTITPTPPTNTTNSTTPMKISAPRTPASHPSR